MEGVNPKTKMEEEETFEYLRKRKEAKDKDNTCDHTTRALITKSCKKEQRARVEGRSGILKLTIEQLRI